MKLKKLSICNIASIESAEIDFDKGALADDPLFLITGKTGAGKTTILNAICLALYNAVPCLTGVKDDRNRESEELKITDPAQLMRKGSKRAEVCLTFESGGVDYKAVWEAHLSRVSKAGQPPKLKQSRQLMNIATGETLTRVSDIKAQINTAVGLTFEQFTRTTMLAQGQFAAFMRAEEKDKADILEKLTGTGIYSVIGRNIFDLMKEAETAHIRLKADIEGIRLLTPEETEQLKQRSDSLSIVSTTATLSIKEYDVKLEWLRTAARLAESLDKCNNRLESADNVVKSDTHRQHLEAIARHDATTGIRNLLASAASLSDRISRLSSGYDKYARREARRIADGLCSVESEIGRARDNQKATEGKLEALRPRQGVYADIQRIEEKSSALSALITKCSDNNVLLSTTEKDLDKSAKAQLPLQCKVDDLDKAVTDCDDSIKDIDTKLAGYDRDALAKTKSANDNLIVKLSQTVQLLETLASRKTDFAEAKKRGSDNAKAIDETSRELDKVNAVLPDLIAADERARAYLDGQKTITDHLAQLKNLYAESHVCPLCGNPHAEILPESELQGILEEATRKAGEAAQALLDARALARSKENDLKSLRTLDKKITSEVSRKQQLVNSTLTQLTDMGYDEPEQLVTDEINARIKSAENENMTLTCKISEADSLQKQRDAVIAKKDKAVKDKDTAQKKLQSQQQKTVVLKEKVAQLRSLLDTDRNTATVSLAELASLTGEELSLVSFADVVKTLNKEASEFNTLTASLDESIRKEQELTRLLDRCRSLLPDEAASLTADYIPTPVAIAAPEMAVSNFRSELSRRHGEIATCTDQLANANADINAYFESSDLTRSEVEESARIPDSDITAWRKETTEAENSLKLAQGACDAVKTQIADHALTKPHIEESDSINSLLAAREAKEKERDAAKDEKKDIDLRLRNDTELHTTYEDKIKLLEKAAGELNEWKALNSMFGNADGARFRAIAQSYVLRALLARANQYLSWLSGRYTLECKDGSLAIDVIDLSHGNTVRNVSLLSGGESFVVSLALALGLSAISKDKIDVDILFIDEGFGTLDHETLETVIETLDTLHRRGGRRIGIISHVAQLAERIPTQIRLVPTGPSSSRVVITQ